ncbi:unnamed protein product [Protopolystoma xenopodis]|uniref:Uncharacterized protein n=1 Tax=Protopolystoma xenopodis TaxID=117903 RepID=A0A3S5C3U6_9PLAT|nr:unnamed protein product [Protopolystoma xenopodis]
MRAGNPYQIPQFPQPQRPALRPGLLIMRAREAETGSKPSCGQTRGRGGSEGTASSHGPDAHSPRRLPQTTGQMARAKTDMRSPSCAHRTPPGALKLDLLPLPSFRLTADREKSAITVPTRRLSTLPCTSALCLTPLSEAGIYRTGAHKHRRV